MIRSVTFALHPLLGSFLLVILLSCFVSVAKIQFCGFLVASFRRCLWSFGHSGSSFVLKFVAFC